MGTADTTSTLIGFPNSFGQGPMGALLKYIEVIEPFWPGNIVIAASAEASNLVPRSAKIKFVPVQERDTGAIANFISGYNNPFVASSLNRFAVEASSTLDVPIIFLDTLAWFWNDIPEHYFHVDRYYCLRTGWAKTNIEKLNHIHRSKVFTHSLFTPREVRAPGSQTVLYITGAGRNPFCTHDYLNSYLDLYALALNQITTDTLVTSGEESIHYLAERVHNKYVTLSTLDHSRYVVALSSCRQFLTTAGFNSVQEAVEMNVPFRLLPSTNLSQWHLSKKLREGSYVDSAVDWDMFFPLDEHFLDLATEKEALPYFGNISDYVLKNKELCERFVTSVVQLMESPAASLESPSKLKHEIGVGGEAEFLEDIRTLWRF